MMSKLELTPDQLDYFREAVTVKGAPPMCFTHGVLEVWVDDKIIVRTRDGANQSDVNQTLINRGTLEPNPYFEDSEPYTLDRDELAWLDGIRFEIIELAEQVARGKKSQA